MAIRMKQFRLSHTTPLQLLLLLTMTFVLTHWYVKTRYSSQTHGPWSWIGIKHPIPTDELTVLITQWSKKKAACHAPDIINPNNMISKRHMYKTTLAKCPIRKPDTFLDHDSGVVMVRKGRKCFYSFIQLKEGTDEELVYDRSLPFMEGEPVRLTRDRNILNTSCYNKMGKQQSINTHILIPKFESAIPSSPDKPSVLVFVVESMSHLVFKRYLNRTRHAISRLGHLYYFDYFIKSGMNSFPNLFALFSGLKVNDIEQLDIWKYRFQKYKLLYDVFKENGYMTGAEKDYSVYDNWKWHFKSQPTDYYAHAFWKQMYPSDGKTDKKAVLNIRWSKYVCFNNNGPKLGHFVDHGVEFVRKNEHVPYFHLMLPCQFTHEDMNNFRHFDKFASDFFEAAAEYMKNTIIVFAGDHGPRLGPSATNSIGRLEDNMPLFVVSVPESVKSKFPHIDHLMKANRKSLLTWLDANKMLTEVATGDFRKAHHEDVLPPVTGPVNPMTQLVPKDRTCEDANVSIHNCVCNGRVHVDPYLDDVKTVARQVRGDFCNIVRFKTCPCVDELDPLDFYYMIPESGRITSGMEHAVLTVHGFPQNVTFTLCLKRNMMKSRTFSIDFGYPRHGCVTRNQLMGIMCRPLKY